MNVLQHLPEGTNERLCTLTSLRKGVDVLRCPMGPHGRENRSTGGVTSMTYGGGGSLHGMVWHTWGDLLALLGCCLPPAGCLIQGGLCIAPPVGCLAQGGLGAALNLHPLLDLEGGEGQISLLANDCDIRARVKVRITVRLGIALHLSPSPPCPSHPLLPSLALSAVAVLPAPLTHCCTSLPAGSCPTRGAIWLRANASLGCCCRLHSPASCHPPPWCSLVTSLAILSSPAPPACSTRTTREPSCALTHTVTRAASSSASTAMLSTARRPPDMSISHSARRPPGQLRMGRLVRASWLCTVPSEWPLHTSM